MADAEQVQDQEVENQNPEANAPEEQAAEGQPDYGKQIAGLESALSDTRKKTQAYEQEIARLHGRLEQIGTKPPEKATKEPFRVSKDEFWADEEAALAKIYAAATEDAISKVQHEQRARWQRRADRQEMKFAKKHADYQEARRAFDQAAQYDRALVEEMLDEPNPAAFVYEWYQDHKSATETGDLQKRLKALEEENKALREGKPAPKPPPKTQAGAREASGAAGGDADPWANRPL